MKTLVGAALAALTLLALGCAAPGKADWHVTVNLNVVVPLPGPASPK